MADLAEFEGYADEFTVLESDLVTHGLGEEPRFRAFVAEHPRGALLGMAVCYVIPWTFDLKPTLVLKELIVAEGARGHGVGRALFAAVVEEGRRIGASRVNWMVMRGNAAAEALYRKEGGQPDLNWEPWTLRLAQQASAELTASTSSAVLAFAPGPVGDGAATR